MNDLDFEDEDFESGQFLDEEEYLKIMSFISQMQNFVMELESHKVWVFAGIKVLHLANNGAIIRCMTELGPDTDDDVQVMDSEYNIIFTCNKNEFDILRDFIIGELGLTNELQP